MKPRPYWNICKIIETKQGADGLIRVVRVLKPDRSIVTTSVSNLYPLELDGGDDSPEKSVESASKDADPNVLQTHNSASDRSVESVVRPKRQAALKFNQNLKQLIENDQL